MASAKKLALASSPLGMEAVAGVKAVWGRIVAARPGRIFDDHHHGINFAIKPLLFALGEWMFIVH